MLMHNENPRFLEKVKFQDTAVVEYTLICSRACLRYRFVLRKTCPSAFLGLLSRTCCGCACKLVQTEGLTPLLVLLHAAPGAPSQSNGLSFYSAGEVFYVVRNNWAVLLLMMN